MRQSSSNYIDSQEHHTIGGRAGHLFRRCVHVLMIAVPIAYYYWGESRFSIILAALVMVMLAELLRIKKQYLMIGQRHHEATHISSFAWGAIAMACVLLWVPNTLYAIPIVAGCAVGDPLIGALRHQLPWYVVRFLACIVIGFIWWVCRYFMPLPIWFPWVISVITVLVEWPNFYWIDDNALMQLVPLAALLLVLNILR